jgi:hypothetical protein
MSNESKAKRKNNAHSPGGKSVGCGARCGAAKLAGQLIFFG